MTKLSEDQLNNLSKEELVSMFLLMQENMSILQERLAVMNENTFGRKTEKLNAISPDQIPRLPLYISYGAVSLHGFPLRLSHSSAYA